MKYLEERFKKYFKEDQKGRHYCKHCYRKINGRYLILQDRGTTSVSGSKAFRIFFACCSNNHLNFVGYTKPVDFTKIYGEDDNEVGKSYEDAEAEDNEIWDYIVNHDPSHKKFY